MPRDASAAGVASGARSAFGDLHVKLTVKMPTELTPEQQKILGEVL